MVGVYNSELQNKTTDKNDNMLCTIKRPNGGHLQGPPLRT